jgi:hypothetical protein
MYSGTSEFLHMNRVFVENLKDSRAKGGKEKDRKAKDRKAKDGEEVACKCTTVCQEKEPEF